jgi:hypothetical protein
MRLYVFLTWLFTIPYQRDLGESSVYGPYLSFIRMTNAMGRQHHTLAYLTWIYLFLLGFSVRRRRVHGIVPNH